MNIKEAIDLGQKELLDLKNDEARAISKRLLSFILNKNITYLSIHFDEEITNSIEEKYMFLINKIEEGIPLQYITNQQYFMEKPFYVNEDVLIPQPDTENLVEEVIKIAKNEHKHDILDLCTGSGAIAISICNFIKDINITASDISKKALAIAKKNAKMNDCYINFIQSDLFEKIHGKFDIIVSNPPYIKTNEIKKLSKEVQNEPIIALDGGEDGLKFYKKIIKQAKEYLKENGYLAVEIGYEQKEAVCKLFKSEEYIYIYSKKDLGNNDRIVIGKRG